MSLLRRLISPLTTYFIIRITLLNPALKLYGLLRESTLVYKDREVIYYNYKQLNYIILQCFKPLKLKVNVKKLKELFIIDSELKNEEV